MNIPSLLTICVLTTAALVSTTPTMAANNELIDFSCPTSVDDEPTIFSEGAQQLPVRGVILLQDRQHSYQLTFTPFFDARQGYVGDILIIGRQYTRNPTTQEKIYLFDKDEFHQEVVEFPFAYCRSHRAPFQKRGNQTIGHLTIEDDSGGSRSARVRLAYVKSCRIPGLCNKEGLGAEYEGEPSNMTSVEFGRGYLNQDLRIMPR